MFLFDRTFAGLPANGYDLIMADPPWRLADWSEDGDKSKTARHHYDLMSLDTIKALPVLDLAARDCVLWLWATAPMFPEALEVMKAWGFRYSTHGVWGKMTKHGKIAFGTGHVLRSSHEPFIIGKRGQPKTAKNVRSLIMAEATGHSRKPDRAFEEAEKMMPGARRLEIFSRRDRPGWTSWGDEVGKFNEVEGVPACAE